MSYLYSTNYSTNTNVVNSVEIQNEQGNAITAINSRRKFC